MRQSPTCLGNNLNVHEWSQDLRLTSEPEQLWRGMRGSKRTALLAKSGAARAQGTNGYGNHAEQNHARSESDVRLHESIVQMLTGSQ